MSRIRMDKEEIQEVRRGLLLRIKEHLQDREDLHTLGRPSPSSLGLNPGRRAGHIKSTEIGILSTM